MNSTIKILKFLLSNKEEQYTIKKLSEKTNINYRIAYEKVIQLEKEGIIKITKAGHAKLCKCTNNFNKDVFEAEYERKKELLHNKDFLVLHKRLSQLKFPFIGLLFGSHAKKTANKHSDIDILTIGGDKKELQMVTSLWPEKIHLTAVSYEDFIHMAKTKEFTVIREAIINNIILIGIEEYYRLLSNAQ